MIVSLADGKQTVFAVSTQNGFWVDENRYVYGVTTGDLDQLGIFVYSRTEGRRTRISERSSELVWSTQNTSGRYAIYVPHIDTIVFHCDMPGQPLCALKLDGSSTKMLTAREAVWLNPEPIDLGLGASAKSPWQTVGSAIGQPDVKTVEHDPNFPGDVMTVKDATKTLPVEEQQLAMEYYNGLVDTPTVANFFDPAKVALKFLDASRTATDKSFISLIMKVDYRDCAFRPSVVRYAITTASTNLKMKTEFTSEQKDRIVAATAQSMADRFMANPNVTKNDPLTLFQDCYTKAMDQARVQPPASAGRN